MLLALFFITVLFFDDVFSGDLSLSDGHGPILSDSHGPISVMGDHMHHKGEIMFSYRFGHMRMDKVMNGTKFLRITEITSAPNGASNVGTYMNSPISMKMDMHMFGAMYAPTDYLTLMAMTSYSEKEMTQQRMPMSGSSRFDVNSSGIGDTRISGLFRLYSDHRMKSHMGLGLSLPTGSIDERDATPASADARLGYAMQNGSGTLDPFFFINNVNDFGKVKLGEQFYVKIPASGKNSKDYEYGENFDATVWSSYRWLDNLSTSVKINYNYQKKMEGSDNEMNPRMSPAMDSRNQGHQKLNFGFGINFISHNEILKNHRLGIEGIFPIYQRYRGIQMSENFRTMIGWQYSF